MNSPLTKAEWQSLESKARALSEAMSEYSTALLLTAGKLPDSDPLKSKLISQCGKLPELGSNTPYFFHCQPEWTGGDSTDPKNFKLREPHVAGLPVRYVIN